MGKTTEINWCHHTFNPWRGCVKLSQACASCYASTWAKRTGKDIWGADKPREMASESYWRQPLNWDADAREAGERRRVFCSSLADVGEDRLDLVKPRERLMRLIRQTQNLDWLLLTKRPENMVPFFNWNIVDCRFEPGQWPTNVWVGTTIENQEWADKRLPYLARIKSVVRFVSVEPMLGRIMLQGERDGIVYNWLVEGGAKWVICGGESGGKARPMHPDWARELRDQCRDNRVPFLFKQWGEYGPDQDPGGKRAFALVKSGVMDGPTPMFRVGKKDAGRMLDGREWTQFPSRDAS